MMGRLSTGFKAAVAVLFAQAAAVIGVVGIVGVQSATTVGADLTSDD